MGLKELRAEIDDEVSTLLGGDFAIEVTRTQVVPHAEDGAITFPDVTAKTQGTKLITTCVLYVDIRRSTELNFSHKATTVAKLYTAFVRAMTHVARYYGGHVRGIIGDRVMVIFDSTKCFTSAVNCAIAMNTVSQHIINRHFKANEVTCGIGIDYGNMLATKTGVRRHGVEQGNWRNLAWLGRPANTASKLTDLANKPAETEQVKMVNVAYDQPARNLLAGLFGLATGPAGSLGSPYQPGRNQLSGVFGFAPTPPSGLGSPYAPSNPFDVPDLPASPLPDWQWREETLEGFLSKVRVEYVPSRLVHTDPNFGSFYLMERTRVVRARTPPILMTARVWNGFRSEQPDDVCVKSGLFKRVRVKTPGLKEHVFGGNVIFPNLKD